MTRGALHGTAALVKGAPRHHHAICASGCGWRGTRTADTPEIVNTGKPCPTCGAAVRAVQP